jgi:hypothetical protein
MDYWLVMISSATFSFLTRDSRKFGKTFRKGPRTLQGVETDYRQARLTRAQRVTARWAA